jgi:hypothetical protein
MTRPSTFGHFELRDELGRGGMGVRRLDNSTPVGQEPRC